MRRTLKHYGKTQKTGMEYLAVSVGKAYNSQSRGCDSSLTLGMEPTKKKDQNRWEDQFLDRKLVLLN